MKNSITIISYLHWFYNYKVSKFYNPCIWNWYIFFMISAYKVIRDKINNFKSMTLSTKIERILNDDFIYSLNFETWVMWASQCYVDRK